MLNFDKVRFKWTFRDYQQEILNNASRFLEDGKINIVAAPGSGKTILGLELITRLRSPCIIFSPTTTIKKQWGERFEEAFIREEENVDDYVSYDLNDIKLINSITYQALYSAIGKIKVEDEEEIIDYSNIDLFKLMKEKGIKTICLDEAHHLQNKWQKSLETFIKGLDKDCKIISLTATPPYDADKSEWERYISVSGEIDDEIFVPELVKEGTLCPHQDYIIFNYPSEEEIKNYNQYKEHSMSVMDDVSKMSFIDYLSSRIESECTLNDDYLFANYKEITALYVFLHHYNKRVNISLFKKINNSKKIPELNLKYGQKSLEFLLKNNEITKEEEKELLSTLLKSKGILVRNIVQLELNDKIKKELTSSVGKLNSISLITNHEYESLKDDLRMLILTDFIKKESVVDIGTTNKLENISVVSIFEKLRRDNLYKKLGVVSGSLVILPLNLKTKLDKYGCKVKNLENTDYGIYTFKGDNKDKVRIVSALFEEGSINILIGTQSLLGEGWDSPCINSLILASYVGSFMLSNQMRGRAIRTYKKNPNKTSNIWHLVTIEPDSKSSDEINSSDYDTLSRRFEGFLAPSYKWGTIESGIDRISIVQPPYNKEHFEKINDEMILKSQDRDSMALSWNNSLYVNSKTVIENMVSGKTRMPIFTFSNTLGLIFTIALFVIVGVLIAYFSIWTFIILILLITIFSKRVAKLLNLVFNHISCKKSLLSIARATLKTFKVVGIISPGSRVKAKRNGKMSTSLSLTRGSLHEQNIFNEAIKEMLTRIDNPRYVIVKKNIFNGLNYNFSFACPSALSKNSKMIEVMRYHMSRAIGEVEIKYTYNEEGRKILNKCRKRSFINKNSRFIKKRQKVTRGE